MTRHYVIYDAPTSDRGRLQEAICGAWVDPHLEHSAEPDCLRCIELIAEDERELASLKAMPSSGIEAIDVYRANEQAREPFETPSHERAARRAGVIR